MHSAVVKCGAQRKLCAGFCESKGLWRKRREVVPGDVEQRGGFGAVVSLWWCSSGEEDDDAGAPGCFSRKPVLCLNQTHTSHTDTYNRFQIYALKLLPMCVSAKYLTNSCMFFPEMCRKWSIKEHLQMINFSSQPDLRRLPRTDDLKTHKTGYNTVILTDTDPRFDAAVAEIHPQRVFWERKDCVRSV